MKLENIRPNFSFASEEIKRSMFWSYADKRSLDFETSSLIQVKPKGTKLKKEPALKVTPEQLALLKTLGLI